MGTHDKWIVYFEMYMQELYPIALHFSSASDNPRSSYDEAIVSLPSLEMDDLSCVRCHKTLPSRSYNFCPYCGLPQTEAGLCVINMCSEPANNE